ncbi:MAG TPA: glycine--tRNA ligase subunit beta [Bacillota bacterium]
MSRLAFEIGCEEIPARFVDPAAESLEREARRLFTELRLEPKALRVLATPRRLILLAEGLPEMQQDRVEWVRGPSARIAYDASGQPTRAAMGFARSQGVGVDELVVRETEQGPYVFAQRVDHGGPAAAVLPAALAELIARIEFPQKMRWGSTDARFIRPVRWLLALLDDQELPVVYGDVRAGRTTRGHRTLAPGPHPVAHAGELPGVLERACVIADAEEREHRIREQLEAEARAAGGRVDIDPELLREVTHLVEWPRAFTGSFAPAYLELPEELLVMTMQAHQRYFPVRGADGRLLPCFVAVRNGGSEGLDLVRAGNEKVLRARLADAKFFFDEDRKQPLERYVPRLAEVTFQERLGSLLDKTRRLERLVAWLADALGIDDRERAHALRAAALAKADQVTHVVYEWPELEGIMGREYARAAGEPEAVAQALAEQYLPRTAGDACPATVPGTLLAAADRLDTLAGSFAIGLDPTGSHDPYGLRRQAATLLWLCRQAALELPLATAFRQALDGYAQTGLALTADDGAAQNVVERLGSFCRQRLEGQLREAGFAADLVEAVLETGWDRIPDVWARAEAGQRLLDSEIFNDVYTAFRRAYNLAREPVPTAVDTTRLELPAEQQLARALDDAAAAAEPHWQARDYLAYWRALAPLRAPVDRFLDDVLVMAPDERLRRNRLALLRRVVELLARPLDLSRLAV